ncbi:EscU/YscU/HrcU family type III secretion system export apparatus switch protein [Buchnera aphidicola (Periphyllus koelreuteriae)]|uniref:EscU/YscU/HrcU family type III secretion system export apparatus switch protein n=1 Tax=Buchnera aphidicola TaxID=9 RepID=UPI0031B8B1F2
MSNNEEQNKFPTENKLKKAKKDGFYTYSRELNSFFLLLFFFIIIFIFKKNIINNIIHIFIINFSFDHEITNENYLFITKKMFDSIKNLFIFSLYILSFLTLINFFSPMCSSNFSFNIKMIKINFENLNFLNNIKKNFSYYIFIDLFKIIFKIVFNIILIGYFFYLFFFKNNNFFYKSLDICLFKSLNLFFIYYLISLISFVPSVIFDIFFGNYLYYKKLKMNDQELKDDIKRSEGNPLIKSKIREKLRSILKDNSTTELLKSDVVIFNYKGYAVSLKYDHYNMVKPKIISKGLGIYSFKILKLSKKYNIPIFESPKLAKNLYKFSQVGQDVPSSFYLVIAEVFVWVWKLKKWKKKGGIYPQPPQDLSIPLNLNVSGNNKK